MNTRVVTIIFNTFPGSRGIQFNMDVHKWTVCVLVSCIIITADGQCSLTCSGFNDCYLLYPQNGKWEYKDQDGTVYDAGDHVYQSPNCYKFITAVITGSCYDAQRECENVGSNITAFNHREEYDQLTNNVLHILSFRSTSTFIVHVLQNLIDLNVEKGCAKINVYDRVLNKVEIENIDCSSRYETNTIICESTDLNTEICPVTTTEINPSSTYYVASTLPPFSMSTTILMNWPTQKSTSQSSNEYSKEQQSRSSQVAVTASVSAVIIIIIIILSFVFVRRIRRRNTIKNNQNRVKFSNGVGVHEHSKGEHDPGDGHNLSYATKSLSVVNDTYDVPSNDNRVNRPNVSNNEETELINNHSKYSNQDNSGMHLYALPNKNKEGSNKELEESRDIQPEPGRHTDHITTFSDGTLYENTKGTIQEDEREVYECLNDADMNAGKDVYAVPNENKESSNQDLEKVGKVQNAQDIQQQTERAEHIETFDDGRPALYENTIGNIQNEDEVYDCLNAAAMFSEYDGYNELNAVGSDGIQSRISGDGTENEYGKLTKKNEQYSYVDTEINQGLVSNPGIGEHTYDKLQRN